MSKPSLRKGPLLIHFILLLIGSVLMIVSISYFWRRVDYIADSFERYDNYFNSRDVRVQVPGVELTLNVAKNDRQTAWKIYTQVATRVAAVEFNEDYDSLLNVHQSLYKLFDLIREEISSLPIEKVQRDKADDSVKFYLSILNAGIRPHLSKWHIPLSKWVENEQKKKLDRSVIEIEKAFPQRKEILASIKEMNLRMKDFAEQLLKIAKTR